MDDEIDPKDMTPEQYAALMGMSVANARQQLAILRDEWRSDLEEVGPDGVVRPIAHGKNWTPTGR